MAEVKFLITELEGKEFQSFAHQARLALGYPPEFALTSEITTKNFDGQSIVEMAMSAASDLAPLVTTLVGYIIAKRGEIKIKKGENEYHFKNINKKDVFEIIDKLKENEK